MAIGPAPLDTGLAPSHPARPGAGTLTCWLNTLQSVDPRGAAELVPLVYNELRRLAAARLSQEPPGQTLQATALVHEAYLRLVASGQARQWNSRGHFFGAAAEAMRRILIENARRKLSQKRGAGAEKIDVTTIELAAETDPERLLLVNEALDKLTLQDAQAAELIKLRFFAGLNGQEAAEVMGLSPRTATRLWAYARAWLFREIQSAAK
jgi:RNA polymerase sigma factor (TIGR02999 family)